MLEWFDYEASLCSGCGHPRAESFNQDGPEYEAAAVQCFACMERELLQKSWRDDEHAEPEGVYFVVSEARGGGDG